MNRFPHLKDSDFPDVSNVDVYAYANDFDYTRYDRTQMSMQLCTVPWDMGEAHIGNRTISGIGNVVFFEDKEERDKWFDDIPDTECYRFETKFKELHRSNQIDVAIPFDVAAKYNYLVVDYNLFANDDSPVMYERTDGLRRWFWFVREVEFIAPNTTKLHLLNDAWQTFIYDLNVSGMMLERGHAPMAAMDAATYLANPIGKCADLLAEDVVNENAMPVGYAAGELVFNASNMKAVIISTANPVTGTFGTKAGRDWKTDGARHFTQDGVPSYCAFALDASNLDTFISNLSSSYPQFIQTIQGICFISSSMLTLGTSFTFASISCNLISSGYTSNDVYTLTKADFGYPTKYADIAKLYTFPYAYLEITDENGDVTEIRIEQTNGKVTFESCVNLVFPWLQISGHLTSNGRGNRRTVSFRNITERSMPLKGDWYKTIKSWDIPMFGITQDAGEYNDFATDYEREHDALAATNEKTSADASADTVKADADASADAAKTNAYASAATAKTNADRLALAAKDNADDSADTAVAIGALQTTANTTITAANITKMAADLTTDTNLNTSNAYESNLYVYGTTNNTIQADSQRATIAANAAYNQAGVGAVTSVLSGNIMGAVGAIAGGSIESGSIMATNSVTVNQTSSQATLQQAYNIGNANIANTGTTQKESHMETNAGDIRDAQNALTTGSTAATAATMKGNALRTYNAVLANTTLEKSTSEGIADLDNTTTKANAARDNTTAKANNARTYATATDAIAAQVKQAAIGAPERFGEFAAGDSATTKPVGLFCDIVTQDPYSIAYAGDEMLRYGYYLNHYWEFDGDWNVTHCKHYAYWKLKDFWVTNLDIPDMYVDKIRFFLFGGVTVWRKPEYIGRTDPYDNMDWSA